QAAGQVESRGAVRGDGHPIPFQLKLELIELGHVAMVLEHQDAWRPYDRHSFSSSAAGSSSRATNLAAVGQTVKVWSRQRNLRTRAQKITPAGDQLVGLADCGDPGQCW